MQKGAFLIHSRNIHCDFPSTFAVCPSDLSSEEMEQMRNKILSATRFIDSLPPHEVRRLVVSCGDKVLAGVVSFLENMASGDRGDARFFRDKEGRPLYAFIGVVFHTLYHIVVRRDSIKSSLFHHAKICDIGAKRNRMPR